jgi:glycosyltransferase involved in cell wall biosynthesis
MNELVSITIPTFNSEKTLVATLESIKTQTYKNIEIIIIDGYSKDKTIEIAKRFGVKVFLCKGGLLEARIVGGKKSRGKFILLLDSDQILEKTCIKRAVKMMENYDALWLYERAFNRKKILPSLYDADRIITQDFWEPDEDIVLPRFFKRKLLLMAWANIPKKYLSVCGAQDHIVTWHEFKQISRKIGIIENGVQHMEPESIKILFRKQYRWGKTTKEFYKTGIYRNLITKKNKFRKFRVSYPVLSSKSFILRILRGVPYKLGFWFG